VRIIILIVITFIANSRSVVKVGRGGTSCRYFFNFGFGVLPIFLLMGAGCLYFQWAIAATRCKRTLTFSSTLGALG